MGVADWLHHRLMLEIQELVMPRHDCEIGLTSAVTRNENFMLSTRDRTVAQMVESAVATTRFRCFLSISQTGSDLREI